METARAHPGKREESRRPRRPGAAGLTAAGNDRQESYFDARVECSSNTHMKSRGAREKGKGGDEGKDEHEDEDDGELIEAEERLRV